MCRNILVMLYLCSCQYLGIETSKDSVTLTRVAETKYEQHIKAINDCLESGGGKELSADERKVMLQQLQREDQQRDGAAEIDPAAYGRICADYSSGTIESEQVRRCRYKLGIYPLAAIRNCVQVARDDTPKIKEQIDFFCQQAKDEMDKLSEEQVTELQLAGLCLYHKLKEYGCSQSDKAFRECGG